MSAHEETVRVILLDRVLAQVNAMRDAIYAGRRFSYLPRDHHYNFVNDLIDRMPQ